VTQGKVINVEDLGEEARKHILDFTLSVCVPLYWHDRSLRFPKPVTGASCFVLRFVQQLVVVTAAHVFRTYEKCLRQNPRLICQLRLLPYDLRGALVDIDDDLDIATFRLSDAELNQIRGIAVDCRSKWPPPKPECGRTLSLAGFPEIIREVHPDGSGIFQAYGALPPIASYSDRQIIITYDPTRDRPAMAGVPVAPLGFNMSGCSGGVVLMPEFKDGEWRYFAVGLIAHGPRDIGPSEDGRTETPHIRRSDRILQDADMIRIRRIHRILPDGSLDRRPDRCLPG
jgi:hypothetical protein